MTARTRKTTPLTDPHLAALLSFLNLPDEEKDGARAASYARAEAVAAKMLENQPITTAFALQRGRPVIYDEVFALVRAWSRGDAASRKVIAQVYAAYKERGADDIPATAVRDVVPSLIDEAMAVGACLMYQLLQGGAR